MRTIPTGGALATLTMIALAGLPQAAQEPEIRRVRLTRDTVVDGIRCAPTGRAYAEFYVADGRLAECPLAVATHAGRYEFPPQTWLIFRPDGRLRLAWLEHHMRLGRVVCKGTGYRKWATTFHDDGSLASCYLPEFTTIDGIPCRAGTFWGEITGGVTVRFHRNGRLAGCGLDRAITIHGTRFRPWQRISLDEEGVPLRDD